MQNGQYKWIDGWPLTYTDWYRNEPTDDGCAAMNIDGWVDLDCTEEHAFFCKTTQGKKLTAFVTGSSRKSQMLRNIDLFCMEFPKYLIVFFFSCKIMLCNSATKGHGNMRISGSED